MASRRSRSTGALAGGLIGNRHDELPSAEAEPPPGAGGQRYHLLFDRAPLPYLVSDFDGTICAANRAAAVLLKRPAELLKGKRLTAFVPLECHAEFCDVLAGLPIHDELRDWRLTLLPHGGAPVDVAIHAAVLHGEWESRDAIFWIVRPRRRKAAN